MVREGIMYIFLLSFSTCMVAKRILLHFLLKNDVDGADEYIEEG